MLSRKHQARPVKMRLTAGGLAGVVGAAAFAAVMELDRRLFRHNSDDLILLGRFVSRHRRSARAAGLGFHLINGGVLGGIYGVVFHERLPGPPWARGTLFATVENVGLYPLLLLEQHHPAIREGLIAPYWHKTAFLQEIIRHLVLGVVLGTVTERIIRRGD